jgi:hypothetical protein
VARASTRRSRTRSARAIVVDNGRRRIAVEVVDQEGLFGTYMDRIRSKVAADGVKLDGIYISATHDESAPDTLGLGGVSSVTSGTNDYFVQYLVDKSAAAIEAAYRSRRPATLRFAEAVEPRTLRQCWSSYPFVDDTRMPVLQAVGRHGRTIATLASVSQHTESLGFNPDATERLWVTADWPHFFRRTLQRRFGGVAIEMAGSVGSVETPEVFGTRIARTPQREIGEDHPAGCRTLFTAPGDVAHKPNPRRVALGYDHETRVLGERLAGAVARALKRAAPSRSHAVWGEQTAVCVPIDNLLFGVAGAAGVFADHPSYTAGCTIAVQPAPNGTTAGTEVKTTVAAFRIGDGEFLALPGEVFPFTYLRGFQGPADLPDPSYGLPPWPLPHMHARWRFFDGLAEDMTGYIFPRGNAVGIPTNTNPDPDDTDRFGCNHSDDSEAASAQAADLLGSSLVTLLDRHGKPERVVTGRYVLPDGTRSRDPLGGPELKCDTDATFTARGPAVGVAATGGAVVRPRRWMTLSGRPQARPDRDTRGYFDARGRRVWLDVFPNQ